MQTLGQNFLESTLRLFRYYKTLGEKAMAQVPDQGLFAQFDEESNSMAMIVQHLSGNMLSRWTDFLSSDGEKDWRNRDEEFNIVLSSRQEVIARWEEGWSCLFQALNSLTEGDLERIVYIRNEGHTVLDAIQRQLAHYPYHVGQLIFAAKQYRSDDWKTLSIARNQSSGFNEEKFNAAKKIKHFTEPDQGK